MLTAPPPPRESAASPCRLWPAAPPQFGILRMRTTDLVLFGTIRYLFMGYGIVSLFFFFMQDNLNAIAVSITGVFGPFVLILACYVVDLSIRRINEQQRWRRRRRRARPV